MAWISYLPFVIHRRFPPSKNIGYAPMTYVVSFTGEKVTCFHHFLNECPVKPVGFKSVAALKQVSIGYNLLINPLSPGIKLQILLLCFHTFLTEVMGRSCSNTNRL